jgi:hypothetical protein
MAVRATGGLEEIDQVPVGIKDADRRDVAFGSCFCRRASRNRFCGVNIEGAS